MRGRREGRQGRGKTRGGAGKTEKCPPSPDNSEATSTPPPAGGRCKTLPVALHEGSAERVSPSPRHPRHRRRRRAPSSVSLQPPLPAPLSPLGPPPTPRGPFQTPWARGGCSGRKRWPRLRPGRRGSERGGGGAPGTVSPATRRGRARRNAGSSRSTAGVRRRRWRREPRDRSITGSHGAGAFSSLRAGASAGHTSSGSKGPEPESPRRAARRALSEGCEPLSSSSSATGWSSARGSRGPGGRGAQAAAASFSAALVARRAGAATAADAVQRNERWGWSVSANRAGECRGRAAGGEGAEVVVTSALLRLHGIPPASRGIGRGGSSARAQEEEGRTPAREGGGGGGRGPAQEQRRWRLRMRPGSSDIKPGSAEKEAAGVRVLASARCPDGNCRRLADAPLPGVGVADFGRGKQIRWACLSGGGAGRGARAG